MLRCGKCGVLLSARNVADLVAAERDLAERTFDDHIAMATRLSEIGAGAAIRRRHDCLPAVDARRIG
jgi:hypothetical protein